MGGADVSILRNVDLFRELSDRDLQKIIVLGKEVSFSEGAEITTEGEKGVGFHLVLDGAAAVTIRGQERGTLKAGDYFGEISLLDGGPRSATVTAAELTRTFSVVSWSFSSLLDQDASIAKKLLIGLCQRLRNVEQSPLC